jgi:small subunit ribosomal protein S20
MIISKKIRSLFVPNKKSAEKRVRQSTVRRLRNKSVKSKIKTIYKNLAAAVNEQRHDEAINILNQYQSYCDRAVKNNILHINTAARYKAKASKLVNSGN